MKLDIQGAGVANQVEIRANVNYRVRFARRNRIPGFFFPNCHILICFCETVA